MQKQLTMRQILIRVALVTLATTVLTYFFTDPGQRALVVVLTVPLAAITSYGSIVISEKISNRIGPRQKPIVPPGPATFEATTERPDHAQRRRTRRQPRGRRNQP